MVLIGGRSVSLLRIGSRELVFLELDVFLVFKPHLGGGLLLLNLLFFGKDALLLLKLLEIVEDHLLILSSALRSVWGQGDGMNLEDFAHDVLLGW